MKHKTLFVLTLATIAACSDDDSVKSGVFVDSAVQGLRYSTKTRSGFTNTAGEFQYAPGETVTFFVGGIELGSSPGADQITPFDLFAVPIPSTEADVVAVMSATSRIDDFDRAANVIYFLVALDRDGDPENGIDLSGWDEALAQEALSFDVDAGDFPYDDYRRLSLRYDGMAASLPAEKALAHFYRTMGIVVPAHIVTSTSVDDGDDGTLEELYTYEHEARGRQTSMRFDDNADGTVEQHVVTGYDSAGNVASYSFRSDNDHNGSFEDRNEYTYTRDAAGRMLNEYFQLVADEVVASRQTRTYTYDARGRLSVIDTEADSNGDSIPNTLTHERTTYDARGFRATQNTETDQGADGSINSIFRRTYAYDAAGFEVGTTAENDPENDGTPNARYVSVYVRDDKGRELDYTQDTFNAAGVLTRRDRRTTAYDERGSVTLFRFETDSDVDGEPNSYSATVSTFDADGFVSVSRSTYDNDTAAPGVEVATDTYTRAPNGAVLAYTTDYDNDGDGADDERQRITNTYDAYGYRIEVLEEFDNTADGVYDLRKRTKSMTSELADGLEYLAYLFIAD